jgi:uncharacterized protein (DUF2249 family)
MNTPITADETVASITKKSPELHKILVRYGLDMCCGGVHPLRLAAQAHGVDLDEILSALNSCPDPESGGKTYILNVHGLEPPEPMVQILSKLSELGPKDALEVEHFREPVPLYAHLEAAGFEHEIEKLGEGRYKLRIYKK